MKKLIVLAVASLVATSANAAEMKWSGSADWRYTYTKNNDGRNTRQTTGTSTGKSVSEMKTKAHQIRANIGATGGWDNIEWGAGMRTTGSANSDYTTLNNNADRNIGLEQAWFRYLKDFGALDMGVTFGRQMNVLAYDSVSQNLFDKDVRWDGFGWQFKFGMFGFNAAQYILGAQGSTTPGAEGTPAAATQGGSSYSATDSSDFAANAQGKFNYLLAFQPHVTWKFSDTIETMLAVGYYLWSDASQTNLSNGGVTDYNAVTTGGLNVAENPANFNMHNSKQWHFFNTWTLPYNLSFRGEYVINKEQFYNNRTVSGYIGNASHSFDQTRGPAASRSALALGITYGALKKANDFTLGYTYGNKGLASVVNTYTNDKFLADNNGHMFSAGYALANNFHLGLKGIFLKEKSQINATTGSTLANNQQMKTTYWELNTGVTF